MKTNILIIGVLLIIMYYIYKTHVSPNSASPSNSLTNGILSTLVNAANPINNATGQCTLTIDSTYINNLINKTYAFKASTPSGKFAAPFTAYLTRCIQQGYLDDGKGIAYQGLGTEGPCTSLSSSSLLSDVADASKVESVAGSLAGLAAKTSLSAVSTIAGQILPGINLITGIIGSIFSAHAQKVKQEQDIICQVIPAVNESLYSIDSQFASGQINLQTALGELQNILSGVEAFTSSLYKTCNSECQIDNASYALVQLRMDVYQNCPTDVNNLIAMEKAA